MRKASPWRLASRPGRSRNATPRWQTTTLLLLVAVGVGSAPPVSRAPDEAATADVRFHPGHGLFDRSLRVTLASDLEGATIRYTLDGSVPSRERGEVYRGAIEVRRSVVVRALAFAGARETSVRTSSYILPGTVARQPKYPAGYVRSFVSIRKRRSHEFDYGMDPEVLNDPRSGNLASHLEELPTLSLALDPRDFNVLYEAHHRRGRRWERPASVELIYPDARRFSRYRGFQVDCALRMQGGLAVDQARKKSFRLLFKSPYGPTKLRYPVFESAVHHARSATDRFDTLVLRAGGNANWSKDDAYKQEPCTYLRDQFIRDTAIEMVGLGARGVFVHLHLNGIYFGLYNVTERPDASFLAAYLGGAKEDYCSVNHSGLVSGDPGPWERWLGALRQIPPAGSSHDRGRRRPDLQSSIDVKNYCDYIILNWFAGVGDWPYNNWYVGYRVAPRGKFLFLNWDSELAFWKRRGYHYSNPTAWVHPLFRRNGSPIARIWRALSVDREFLMTFADRVARHCAEDGPLADRRMKKRFQALADAIENSVVAESARWGDAAWGTENSPRTRERHWYPNRDHVLQLLEGNVERFIAALRGAGYYPLLDAPRMPRRKVLTAPAPLRMASTSRRGAIYFTTDGSDPRAPSGDISPRASRFDATNAPVIAVTSRVRARVRDGEQWSALTDSTWLVGSERLPIRISEIMYHPPDSEALEFVEIQNVSSAPLELGGTRLTGVRYGFPSGAEIAAGAVIVLIPDDDPERFAREYPGVEVFGTYRGHLSNGGETVLLLDRAGGVIDRVTYADGEGWPEAADGGGHSLERSRSRAGGPESWRASDRRGGTPGAVGDARTRVTP